MGPVETPGAGSRSARQPTVAGPPAEVADELVLALADQPGALVCDLTGRRVSTAEMTRAFAPVLRYITEWPGVPVVVCAPEQETRERVRSLPFADHLIVSASPETGLAEVRGPPPQRGDLHLPATTAAPAAARGFTARLLRGWRLHGLVDPAALVVSELVTNSVMHAATPVTLTLSRTDGRVQVLVRDHGGGTPRMPEHDGQGHDGHGHTLGGRGLLLVQAISRGWGVFPARPRGKAVWAVLDTTTDGQPRHLP